MPAQTIDALTERVSELEQNINTIYGRLAELMAELRKEMSSMVHTEHLHLSIPSEPRTDIADSVGISVASTELGALSIQGSTGTLELGVRDKDSYHFHTDRDKYHFDKEIRVSGSIGSDNYLNLRSNGKNVISVLPPVYLDHRPSPEYVIHIQGDLSINGSTITFGSEYISVVEVRLYWPPPWPPGTERGVAQWFESDPGWEFTGVTAKTLKIGQRILQPGNKI